MAFEGLLNNGVRFAERLASGFSEERTWPQLVHIATDGETYGHHHPHGDMALAYALQHIESNQLAVLTNYAQFLDEHPPTHEVQIFENSSWSCVHGVERWRSNCGCSSGHPGWNQEWRAPLRAALDFLRDVLAPSYQDRASELLRDPWAARNDYIEVVLDRSPENVDRFFARQASRPLDGEEMITALKLLEMQRHAMLMYTSCGWFFDELSGIETVQVLHYAGRAVRLAQELFGDGIESAFIEQLAKAKSNLPEAGDGARIYEKWVKTAALDLPKVGAHYAISSLFESYDDHATIYCYSADRREHSSLDSGNTRLAVGRARFTSDITRESADLTYGTLHFGDHNISGGVREFQGEERYREMVGQASDAFSRADFPEVIRIFDKEFGTGIYSLKSLFRDEQRKIVNLILASTVKEAEAISAQVYEHHASLVRYLASLSMPLPRVFQAAAEFALNRSLKQAFSNGRLDPDRVQGLLQEAAAVRVPLDVPALEFELRKRIERAATEFGENPAGLDAFRQLNLLVRLAAGTSLNVNLAKVQNICYEKLIPASRDFRSRAAEGDPDAQEWMRLFDALIDKLSISAPDR